MNIIKKMSFLLLITLLTFLVPISIVHVGGPTYAFLAGLVGLGIFYVGFMVALFLIGEAEK